MSTARAYSQKYQPKTINVVDQWKRSADISIPSIRVLVTHRVKKELGITYQEAKQLVAK